MTTQIAIFVVPTWGPPGTCRPQMGPMLAPWTLLSVNTTNHIRTHHGPLFIWRYLKYVAGSEVNYIYLICKLILYVLDCLNEAQICNNILYSCIRKDILLALTQTKTLLFLAYIARSRPLMIWRHKEPGHQQLLYSPRLSVISKCGIKIISIVTNQSNLSLTFYTICNNW